MLRFSCLIIGILLAVLLLSALITCRITGLPVSNQSLTGLPGLPGHGMPPQWLPGGK